MMHREQGGYLAKQGIRGCENVSSNPMCALLYHLFFLSSEESPHFFHLFACLSCGNTSFPICNGDTVCVQAKNSGLKTGGKWHWH